MPVHLRLSRLPFTRNAPRYNLVAVEASRRATAKPLEVLGTYDPKPVKQAPVSSSLNGQRRDEAEWGPRQYPAVQAGTGRTLSRDRAVATDIGVKVVEWNKQRIEHWLDIGAQPSKPVERLLNKAGILRTDVFRRLGTKPVSKETRINRAVRAMRDNRSRPQA